MHTSRPEASGYNVCTCSPDSAEERQARKRGSPPLGRLPADALRQSAPHTLTEDRTFHAEFELPRQEPRPKKAPSPKPRKPKPTKPQVRKPRIPTRTDEKRTKARRDYDKARDQKPERKEAARLLARKNLEKRKAAGLCKSCPSQAIPGQTRCEACRDKHRESRQAYDTKRRQNAKNLPSTLKPRDQEAMKTAR